MAHSRVRILINRQVTLSWKKSVLQAHTCPIRNIIYVLKEDRLKQTAAGSQMFLSLEDKHLLPEKLLRSTYDAQKVFCKCVFSWKNKSLNQKTLVISA